MEFDFSEKKVHNEIEYCVIKNNAIKKKLESAFLANRISYYEKWDEPNLIQKLLRVDVDSRCTICINSQQVERADEVMHDLGLARDDVAMVKKYVDKTYF